MKYIVFFIIELIAFYPIWKLILNTRYDKNDEHHLD
jgi:hypothetical protein